MLERLCSAQMLMYSDRRHSRAALLGRDRAPAAARPEACAERAPASRRELASGAAAFNVFDLDARARLELSNSALQVR